MKNTMRNSIVMFFATIETSGKIISFAKNSLHTTSIREKNVLPGAKVETHKSK